MANEKQWPFYWHRIEVHEDRSTETLEGNQSPAVLRDSEAKRRISMPI